MSKNKNTVNADADAVKESVIHLPESDSWEQRFNEEGEFLQQQLEKLNIGTKSEKSEIPATKKPLTAAPQPDNESKENVKIDYLSLKPTHNTVVTQNAGEEEATTDFTSSEYAHIVEIYDFSVNMKNEHIITAFKDFLGNDNMSLKWVDDTHCLALFPNASEAFRVLSLDSVVLKVRSMANASEDAKRMAQRKISHLKPYKPRPQTSSLVASKLIGASLGINNLMSKEKVALERKKLASAKDKHLRDKDLKESAWNGE